MSEQAITPDAAPNRPATIPVELTEFINALFLEKDTILIRPTEAWVEKGSGKKRSRVIFNKVRYPQASRLASAPVIWTNLLKVAEEERANLFFGVCPRLGNKSQFDKAWQIRTVRALWADLDHCTVEEALQRCEAAGLPRPSVTVRSGNGSHLYWLLVEPFLIDDVGEPPPVQKRFRGKGEKPLLFIPGPDKARAEMVYEYLDEGRSDQKNPAWPTVSPKGRHVQDVVAGIAAKIGGDHTQDLARLLRLPCTLNRKDQRNGKVPVPCELVECDLERRYPFADFERLAEAAPDRVRVEGAAKIRLPTGKKLTPHRRSKLNDFINASALSGVGDRSEPDFALCAWAIEQGIEKEEVWPQLVDVGKFGERGRDYFDLTWGKAEDKVRQKVYDRVSRKAMKRGDGAGTNGHTNGSFESNGEPQHAGAAAGPRIDAGNGDLAVVTNQAWDALCQANEPPTLFRYGALPARIETDDDGQPLVRPMTVDRMRHRLAKDVDWYAVNEKTEIEEPAYPPVEVVRNVLATPDLPLPVLTRIVEAPVFAADGTLQTTPGYSPASKTYFVLADGFTVPPVSPQPSMAEIEDATGLLSEDFLGEFPFVEGDQAHALAALLCPFARELIHGPTPLHDFEAPEPGTGKTLLVDVLTVPALGRPATAMSEGRDEDEWRKRILAKLMGAPSLFFIDNVRRRVDSAALSSAITAYPLWEDRVLGKSEIVRVPVRCTWILTGNNPAFSSEMARRTIRCRLDAKMDQPWLRTGFRHPNLMEWARDNRGRLVWAALTLIQAWLAVGRPAGEKTLGMFEDWARVIGGILDVAMVRGFLDNLQNFYQRADAEGATWREFVAAWWNIHKENEVLAAQLYNLAVEAGMPLGDKSEQSQKVRLGQKLAEARDRVFSIQVSDNDKHSLRIEHAGAFRRATLWSLRPVQVCPV